MGRRNRGKAKISTEKENADEKGKRGLKDDFSTQITQIKE
jgi:hypothetical protein